MSHEFSVPVPEIDGTEPVGVAEIAERLGVKDRSVHMWKRRERLPPPDYDSVNGCSAWEWTTILWWAGETDRLRTPQLVKEFRKTFKVDPPKVWRAAKVLAKP